MKTETDSYQRILIRAPNWVGDALMATPAVRAIRKNFAKAQISILAKPWVAPVFEGNPYVDRIIAYDAAGRHGGLGGKWRLALDLGKMGYDLAILLQNAFEAALITCLARIPNRLGFTTDGRGWLLTHGVRLNPRLKKIHQTGYYLGILEGTGLCTDGRKTDLFLSPQDIQAAEEYLSSHGIERHEWLIGLNPGAEYGTAKRWFPERYAALANRLVDRYGCRILIFGGPGQETLGRCIAGQIRNGGLDLSSRTTLRQAMALVRLCRLFITNDSGLMHVAAALGVRQIAIFGSTDPVTTAPFGMGSHMLRTGASCAPCLLPHCPTDHHCMQSISVEMVFAKAQQLLGNA